MNETLRKLTHDVSRSILDLTTPRALLEVIADVCGEISKEYAEKADAGVARMWAFDANQIRRFIETSL